MDKRIPEPSATFDHEPVATRLTFRYNDYKIIEEENTMTISELALNLIEHADMTPGIIDLDTAKTLIGWMDPETNLPENLTPESFMEAWNDIIRSGDHEDNWSKID